MEVKSSVDNLKSLFMEYLRLLRHLKCMPPNDNVPFWNINITMYVLWHTDQYNVARSQRNFLNPGWNNCKTLGIQMYKHSVKYKKRQKGIEKQQYNDSLPSTTTIGTA